MRWIASSAPQRSDPSSSGVLRTSGNLWSGLSLNDTHSAEEGALPEGHFLEHLICLSSGARRTTEVQLGGSPWQKALGGPMALEFLPAGMPFALRWREPNDVITISIQPAFVMNVLGSDAREISLPQYWGTRNETHITQLVLAMANDVRDGSPGGRIVGESLGAALVAQLATKVGVVGERLPHKVGLAPKTLRTILDCIQADLCGDLSLRRLAGLTGMSLDGFIRSFKRSTGVPPHQYVLRKRVESAQALLADRRLSLTEIALRTGFSDQSHFSKIFRRMIGVAPRSYRQRVQQSA
jgi:AraC family transcriptional regulator